MGLQQSNLTSTGYDVVIATTQDSTNAMMQTYMRNVGNKFGVITEYETVPYYYMYPDDMTNPVQYTDKAGFMAKAGGTDPLAVIKSDWNTSMPMTQDITNLTNAHFLNAFTAEPGIPKYYTTGDNPPVLPQLFEIAPDNQSAIITMLFKSFSYVFCGYDENSSRILHLYSRTQQADEAWFIKYKVPFANNVATDIPDPVQQQATQMGNSPYSIQQLLLDFSKATPVSCTDGLHLDYAWKPIAQNISLKNVNPVLGYSIVTPNNTNTLIPPAFRDLIEFTDTNNVTVTGVEIEANAFVDGNGNYISSDDSGLATLNYVCAVNSHSLKGITPIKWNWLDTTDEETSYHGAIGVSRNMIAKFISTQILPSLRTSCYSVYVKANTVDVVDVDFPDPVLTPGQSPTLTYYPSGATLLDYSYTSSSSDTAGLLGCNGTIELDNTFDAKVSYTGNTLTIVRHLVMKLNVSVHGTYSGPVSVVDKTLTDVYTLTLDGDGNLQFSAPVSTPLDQSTTGNVGNYTNWSWMVNQDTSTFAKAAQALVTNALQDIELSSMQQFIFPGGEVFSLKDVTFSDYGDLVGHITYAGL